MAWPATSASIMARSRAGSWERRSSASVRTGSAPRPYARSTALRTLGGREMMAAG